MFGTLRCSGLLCLVCRISHDLCNQEFEKQPHLCLLFLETFQLFPVSIIFNSTCVISIFKIQSAFSFKIFHVCVTLTINKSPEFNICSY